MDKYTHETPAVGQSPALNEAKAVDAILRAVLVDVLGLEADSVRDFGADTGLFGYLPELDSMAVATLLTEMEDRLMIVIEDDEVDGEMLESFGTLLAFAQNKRSGN
ncbi:MAG: acyl carrier protein [Novosphingobium sp.]|nr:acyl carrier protein [Novosphingobium sp.]